MHGWVLMLALQALLLASAAVLACSTQGWWPPKGSAEDSPHATLQHAKVARDPFTLSPSCSPEGQTGRGMLQGYRETPGLPV